MNTEQRVAFVLSQIACMNAERAGMESFNQQRALSGSSPGYGEEEFDALGEKFGLTHNQVIAYLLGEI